MRACPPACASRPPARLLHAKEEGRWSNPEKGGAPLATIVTEKAAPGYAQVLETVRKGMRSCLACRTAFPNRLALMKHEVQGCRKR